LAGQARTLSAIAPSCFVVGDLLSLQARSNVSASGEPIFRRASWLEQPEENFDTYFMFAPLECGSVGPNGFQRVPTTSKQSEYKLISWLIAFITENHRFLRERCIGFCGSSRIG
jgi:hypothetical protein